MPFDIYNALLEAIDQIFTAGNHLSSQTRGRRRARYRADAIHPHLQAQQG